MEEPGRVHGPLPRLSRAAHVTARVLDVLTARFPLTVLRGPRGYGKTTALVHWLTQATDGVDTVYLPLDDGARTTAGFWRAVATALCAAGLEVPSGSAEEARRTMVLQVLLQHRRPLRLVLDNYYGAGQADGAEQVDLDLLEVVRANPELELVVATRGLRTLETVGALSIDVGLVRPSELALRAPEVHELARAYGVEMTLHDAGLLVLELGGWPAALRTCIAAAGAAGTSVQLEDGTIDGYLEVLLADLQAQSLREFLLRTSVPEEFSAAAAAAMVPGHTAMRELRNLRLAGIVRARETVDGLRYSYPPAIRDGLRRIGAEQYPELTREVHRVLMSYAAHEEGPAGVLRHAARAQEWDVALRVMAEEWALLLARHPRVLAEVAAQFPRELSEGDPRLRVIRRHLHRMASPAGAAPEPWQPTGAYFVDAAMRQRWRELQGRTDESLVLFESGVASIFAGENEAAAYAFGRVREQGVGHDDRTARLLGIGGMLFAAGLHGHADQALELLQDPELTDIIAGEGSDEVSLLARVGGRVVHAIAAVDAMAPDAHEAIDALLEPAQRDELWGLAVSARGQYASVHGSPQEQARVAGQIRAALRYLEPASIAYSTLATQLVELLVAGGIIDVAAQVFEQMSDTFVSAATHAYLLYAQRRDQEAIEVAEHGLADPRMTARSRLHSEIVVAAALQRLGQPAAARERFARGVQVAYATGQRRAFELLSEQDFTMLAALAGNDPAVLVLRSGGGRSAAPVPVAVPMAAGVDGLSVRELEVLASLRHHPGPAGVAAELGMSVNTAKTHLRHVYRKLGAAGRDEALLLSRRLTPERQ